MSEIIKARKEGNQLYTYDSTLRKLKTHWEDSLMYLTRTSIHAEVRERFFTINYPVLRRMAERLSMVSAIINTRQQQIMPFLKPASETGQPGFCIHKKGEFDKRYKKKDKRAEEIQAMIEQTGFIYDPFREDDFIDFGLMVVREALVIDQVAIELQRNRRGEVSAFWLVDGATIFRCTEKGYEQNKKLAFVQILDGKVEASYTKEEMIFDYMFKRADLHHRGFGYSLLEQAVDLITTLIFGITYNRDQFVKDKVPKGFIALQGEADAEAMEAVERYWQAAMTGVGARFTIPIIPSGKEGVSLDFKTLNPSNKDIEYYKMMLFFLSLFASVFGMDLAEMGIKTDTHQTFVGENLEGRIKYSKARGLESLLTFMQSIMMKIMKKIDEDYEFVFVGIDKEDEERKYKVVKAAIESDRTINEMREEDGLDAKDGEEYDTVLNSNLVQIRQLLSQQQSEAEGEEYDEGEAFEEEGEEGEGRETFEGEESEEGEFEEGGKVEKGGELKKHVEALQKAGYELEIEI
ncbi:hypothetical protein LCGC14_1331630 [marine sediment metagenome]|uniref:Uncharacterized protein n=1 Tax=marine sediment metagenome TaxID=412755 RepID=A0A0F9NIT5_9ZZZZ